jgi:hypothetical protein
MRPSRESEHGVSGALAALNQAFLTAHAEARQAACTELESERLVIRYAFGKLEARYKGLDLLGGAVDVLPPEYHPIKDVCHATILAALLFHDESSTKSRRATAIVSVLDAALAELHDSTSATTRLIPAAHLPRQRRLLRSTRAAVLAFSQGRLSAAGQRKFFAEVRPDLDENIRAVSGAFLRELHRRMQDIRHEVPDADAWDSVLVIVGTSHQARAREIGVQYFERLLAEPVGEGARNERRLVISESVGKASDQYGLLATHLVDQESGALVFGDPLRLQWDVLANNAGVLDELLPR